MEIGEFPFTTSSEPERDWHNVSGLARVVASSQVEEVKSAVMGRPQSADVLMDTARQRLTALLDSKCYIPSHIQLSVVNAIASQPGCRLLSSKALGIGSPFACSMGAVVFSVGRPRI